MHNINYLPESVSIPFMGAANYLPESVSIPFMRAALKNFCMLGSM